MNQHFSSFLIVCRSGSIIVESDLTFTKNNTPSADQVVTALSGELNKTGENTTIPNTTIQLDENTLQVAGNYSSSYFEAQIIIPLYI